MKKAPYLLVASLLVLQACAHLVARVPVSKITPHKLSLLTTPVSGGDKYTPALSLITPSMPLVTTSSRVPATRQSTSSGQIARRYILALSETIGARPAGTPQEAEAARYIQTVFQEQGYNVQLQPFSFEKEDDGGKTSLRAVSDFSQDVIAVKPGLSTREIIVGAHYDSVDVGRGADDNASGVGVMLEVAELIQGAPTPYTVRFVTFGTEETGLKGSSYYVEHMSTLELQNTVAMVNLDSLIAGDITYAYGSTNPKGDLRDWIMEKALSHGFEMQTQSGKNLDLPDGTPCDCSDYAPFEHAGIPFVYFEATNWNLGKQDGYTQVDLKYGVQGEIWHTKFDNLDYIEQTFPRRIDDHLYLYVMLLYETLTQFVTMP
jgi:alkaline phosphatase isozyme conversion protein